MAGAECPRKRLRQAGERRSHVQILRVLEHVGHGEAILLWNPNGLGKGSGGTVDSYHIDTGR